MSGMYEKFRHELTEMLTSGHVFLPINDFGYGRFQEAFRIIFGDLKVSTYSKYYKQKEKEPDNLDCLDCSAYLSLRKCDEYKRLKICRRCPLLPELPDWKFRVKYKRK